MELKHLKTETALRTTSAADSFERFWALKKELDTLEECTSETDRTMSDLCNNANTI